MLEIPQLFHSHVCLLDLLLPLQDALRHLVAPLSELYTIVNVCLDPFFPHGLLDLRLYPCLTLGMFRLFIYLHVVVSHNALQLRFPFASQIQLRGNTVVPFLFHFTFLVFPIFVNALEVLLNGSGLLLFSLQELLEMLEILRLESFIVNFSVLLNL